MTTTNPLPGKPGWNADPSYPTKEAAMSPDAIRPFPADDYHPHFPDAEGDYMVLLLEIAALIPAPADEADEPVLVRAVPDTPERGGE